MTTDVARLVAERHVADLTHNLQPGVHIVNHLVQTVGDQSDLLVEFRVGGQIVGVNITEGGEPLLGGGILLENPDREESKCQIFNCFSIFKK